MERGEVVSKVRQSDVQLVRFLYCDNGGVIRGKTAHVDDLEGRLSAGIGLTVAMQAMNSLDQLQSVSGMGPVGEIRLVPDPDTFVVLPYAPRAAAMLSDMVTLDAQPWDACPRSFLKRMVKRAAGEGLQFKAGFEPEWSLAVRVEDRYVPFDETLCFSSIGMQTAATVIDEVVEAIGKQGMRVEQYYPELGHGQQELSIRYAPALRAADNQVLYRETVRAVAYKNGYFASFAPKPWPEHAGNGCHIHLSVWDPSGEENLFFDRSAPYQLGRLGRQFAAGLLEHLPGLVALTCPSYNSYHRLQPQSWSSAYTCYGPDNREAAVRIVSTYWGQEMPSINLELKAADNSANPYLALGGVIAAGLDGIMRGLELGEERLALEDPFTIPEEEREARGIRRLPDSLSAALEALEADSVLTDALGGLLLTSFLAVRRSEWEAYSAQGPAFEHKHHFWKY
ncbi:MAG TPA: glutamine synthetase family protein [Chloroflexota bacterium]|nr:glutamine synthetase family protein [Chloroflexota bacterium]